MNQWKLARRGLSILALSTLLLTGCGHVQTAQLTSEQRHGSPEDNTTVAITNVVIVNVASGAKHTGMTVVIKARRITDVGQGISIPSQARRLDGTGKFLIPGLWDMHTHHQATGVESLGLFVANGVVGTRDMGSDIPFILPLRDRVNRRELLGPEIVAAGPILDERPLDWPFRRKVTNAQEAREAVRDLKRQGVDFIKVHDSTPRDAYFAIADEAARLGLPFAGHVPLSVKIEEAADSGIRSIEHLSNFRVFNDCSMSEPHNAIPCQALFEKLAAKGVWQTPTMTFFQAIPDLFSGKPLAHGEYASDSLLALMRKNMEVSKLSDEALAWFRANGTASLRAIRDLLSSGSRFLAGSDGLVPGFSLHDELEWLTRAGLSPLESLQTATINPARFLGRENVQGTIEAGKRADLLLLDADPLSDISNIRHIAAVLVQGQLLLRPELERIVAARRRPVAQFDSSNVRDSTLTAAQNRVPDPAIVQSLRSWLDQLAQQRRIPGPRTDHCACFRQEL